jgi:hypothetical protein
VLPQSGSAQLLPLTSSHILVVPSRIFDISA